MPLMQWEQDMSVGVAVLDQDHQTMFAMLNELYDAVQSGTEQAMLGSLFERLVAYAARHFAEEEARMAAGHYPGLAAHRVEHGELTARVLELRQRFLSGSGNGVHLELLVLFKTWLTSHIRCSDRAYRPYVIE